MNGSVFDLDKNFDSWNQFEIRIVEIEIIGISLTVSHLILQKGVRFVTRFNILICSTVEIFYRRDIRFEAPEGDLVHEIR